MRIGRRGLLGLGLAGLVGCAPTAPAPTVGQTSATSTPGSQSSPSGKPSPSARPSPTADASAVADPSPGSEPSPGVEPVEARGDIVARYSDHTPTQWGLQTDSVVQRSAAKAIAVTLDACGGPNGSGYDEALIAVLRRLEVPATLFMSLRWIEANPRVADELADDPLFEVANHGTLHKPLSVTGQAAYGIPGTTSVGEVYDEVMGAHGRIEQLTGAAPRWFRSGTAHVDDVAVAIVKDLGQQVVNFDINADAGGTFTAAQVRQAMLAARSGSICIGHFNRPGSGTGAGMQEALPALRDAGHTFARLRDVL